MVLLLQYDLKNDLNTTPKKGNTKECSNYPITSLISHASKVMLKILQARLQQHRNWEFPDVQVGFRKGRRNRNQIANMHWIKEKAREFQKNIYFCFTDYAKVFDCVGHNKLRKILKEMGVPDHLERKVQKLAWNSTLRNYNHGIWSHHFRINIREIMEAVTDFIFLGCKITVDSDCSHEIKGCLLLGRKVMTNIAY